MTTSHTGGLRQVFRNLRQLMKPRLRAAATVLALVCFVHSPETHAHELPDNQTRANSALLMPGEQHEAEIISLLTREIQDTVDRQKRLDGQSEKIHVRIWFGTLNKETTLFIDLGDAWVPTGAQYFDAEMEDLTDELQETAVEILKDKDGYMPIRSIQFRFDGKTIEQAFPGEAIGLEMRDHASDNAKRRRPTVAPALIVTSAGHGVYYHYGFEDWRPQRDPYNGITEDFITPSYATELANLLQSRSGATTRLTRSSSTNTHMPSGYPWEQVAARYYLQKILPNNPGIWHSRPNDMSNLRERNEDINSRPLYANHIGATTLINMHTNGGSPAASGTQVYFHAGRIADQQLGDSILCGMKELIHAQSGYEGFSVQSSATGAINKAENKLATMPSVIVETAFHTNPSDAAALQDPAFRNAAMKGVEKGYRLNAEGKICKPFKITSIPDVTAQRPNSVNVPVNFEGFPYFPVTLTVEYTSCPAGETCTGGTVDHSVPEDSPFVFSFECSGSSSTPSTSSWRSYLTDADGVKTNAVAHSLTCMPNAGKTANGKPSMRVRSVNL